MYKFIHEDFETLFDEVSPSAVVARRSLGLNPSLRFFIIRKHLYVGVNEDARQPCLPSEPLIVGDHGYFSEVVVVFAAEEFDLFPSHVHGVADHRAQVKQQVHRAGGFELVYRLLFECLEIGDGKFTEHGDVDEVFGLFDGDHILLSIVLETDV